jgi:hypothetical protein
VLSVVIALPLHLQELLEATDIQQIKNPIVAGEVWNDSAIANIAGFS